MAFNINDFIVGLDPTGFSSITGAQLAQLVNGATPSSDRGMVIWSADTGAGDPVVPNASNTGQTEWQRYVWIRQSGSTTSAYVWNSGGPNTNYVNPVTLTVTSLLQWIPITVAGIGAGSITGAQIAVGTITAANITSAGLPSSILTGSVPPSWLSSAPNDGLLVTSSTAIGTGGGSQVTGTFSIMTIAAASVTLANMAKQSVSGNATALQGTIVDGSITTTQLLAGVNGFTSTPATGTIAAVDPGCNMMVNYRSLLGLPSSSNYNPGANAVLPGDVLTVNTNAGGSAITGWIPCRRAMLTLADPTSQTYQQTNVVAPNATAYSLVNTNTLGRILQIVQVDSTTVVPASGVLANSTSTPQYNSTGMTAAFNSGAFTKLDTTGASKLLIEVSVCISTNQLAFVGLYNATGATNALAGVAVNGNNQETFTAVFSYWTGTNPANATYYIAFGCLTSSASTAVNSLNGSTNPFLISRSSIRITEYI